MCGAKTSVQKWACVQKTVCADSKLTLAMWSVECGVRSAECGVCSVECGAGSLKCGM